MLSITGRQECTVTCSSSARYSSGLPMVVPTIERHAQYTSETGTVEVSPPVSPKLTNTPPHCNAASASGQQSAPQLSITASKPPAAAWRRLDPQPGCE